MRDVPLRRIILSVLLVLATTPSAVARPPQARTPPQANTPAISFDGRWSVVIITDAGTCDRAYRYGLRIAGGRIYYSGEAGVMLSGQVDAKGNVVVNLRYGESTAQGSGTLTESDGEGRWQGASPTSRCSGRWEAQRRD
jgi:hypothetical protein